MEFWGNYPQMRFIFLFYLLHASQLKSALASLLRFHRWRLNLLTQPDRMTDMVSVVHMIVIMCYTAMVDGVI
jgi:hypothetical protein